MTRCVSAVLVAVVAVAASLAAAPSGEAVVACRELTPVPSAHRPSGADPGTVADLTGCVLRTGRRSMEPSIGFTSDGRTLFQAWELAGAPGGIPPEPRLLRLDGGEWTDVSPLGHPTSLDPILYVDRATNRIFTLNWLASGVPYCSTISFSDDDARTWTTSPLACGGFDGESIGAGPPATSVTIGYPNVVYYCTGASLGTGDPVTTPSCSKSIDGGLTFAPTGGLPFPAMGDDGVFPGWGGNPVVDAEGSLYLPKRWSDQPYVAISRDEGVTWSRVAVAGNGSAGAANRMAVAPDGTLHYTWIGGDHLPYIARSTDRGATWSEPIMIAPSTVDEAALARVTVRQDGAIAVAYVGTAESPGPPYYEFCNVHLSDCADGAYAGVEWHGYVALIEQPGSSDPLIRTVVSGAGPLFVGGCSADGACKAVLDFIDVGFDHQGDAWAAFVDDCAMARDFQPVFSPQLERCGDGVGEGIALRLH